jgi:hypothetical protein
VHFAICFSIQDGVRLNRIRPMMCIELKSNTIYMTLGCAATCFEVGITCWNLLFLFRMKVNRTGNRQTGP